MTSYGKRTIGGCPPWAQETVLELVRLGWEENSAWRFLEEVDIPDRNHRHQVRNEADLAPIEDVNLYAENMRQGDRFPPLVITSDGYLIDGNTRAEAAMKLTPKGKRAIFPAVVLEAAYEGATQATLDRFTIIGVASNNKHGKKMKAKDVEAAIRGLMRDGVSQTDVARMLHVHANTVKNVHNAGLAAARLQKLGIDPTPLSRTTLAEMQTKGGVMMDAPFREIGDLAIRGGLKTAEVSDMIREVNDVKSETSQMRILDGVRESRTLQVSGITHSSSLANIANRSWGFFLKHADNPSVLAQTGTRLAREEWVRKGHQAVAVQQKALAAVEAELENETRR